MTSPPRDFGDPDYWIKNAEGDLAMARARVPGASVETRYAAIEDFPESRLDSALRAAQLALNWAKKEVARAKRKKSQAGG